jgi:type VI protein secretion system component VasK
VANQETLSELESLRIELARLQEYDRHGAPLWYRWGLYSGSGPTGELHSLYFDRFRRMFMDPMLATFTARFGSLQSSAPVPDDVYTLLKSYRMITSGECPLDEGVLGTTLMPVWSSAVPNSSDASELAEKQMQFYVSDLKIENPYKLQIAEDGKAVAQAQAYLRDLNGPDRMFRALVEQINHDKPGDSLTRYAANYTEVMTGPNIIEAAYTRDGWEAMLESIRGHKATSAGDTCVLGSGSRVANVTMDAGTENGVEELYIKSYIQHWKQFLAAHHVVSFSSTGDAARKLGILADNNRSPLLGLAYMTSHGTDLGSAQAENSVVVTAVEKGTNEIKKKLGNLFAKPSATGITQGQAPADVVVNAAERIAYEFESVHQVADPSMGLAWP